MRALPILFFFSISQDRAVTILNEYTLFKKFGLKMPLSCEIQEVKGDTFSNIVGSVAFANSRRRKSPTAKKRL